MNLTFKELHPYDEEYKLYVHIFLVSVAALGLYILFYFLGAFSFLTNSALLSKYNNAENFAFTSVFLICIPLTLYILLFGFFAAQHRINLRTINLIYNYENDLLHKVGASRRQTQLKCLFFGYVIVGASSSYFVSFLYKYLDFFPDFVRFIFLVAIYYIIAVFYYTSFLNIVLLYIQIKKGFFVNIHEVKKNG